MSGYIRIYIDGGRIYESSGATKARTSCRSVDEPKSSLLPHHWLGKRRYRTWGSGQRAGVAATARVTTHCPQKIGHFKVS
jgi:hypothetical protein